MAKKERRRVMFQLDEQTQRELDVLSLALSIDESKVMRRAISTMYAAFHNVNGRCSSWLHGAVNSPGKEQKDVP